MRLPGRLHRRPELPGVNELSHLVALAFFSFRPHLVFAVRLRDGLSPESIPNLNILYLITFIVFFAPFIPKLIVLFLLYMYVEHNHGEYSYNYLSGKCDGISINHHSICHIYIFQ